MKAFKEYKRQLKVERNEWPRTPCSYEPRLWLEPASAETATKVCLKSCPMVQSCLAFAITYDEQVGVWGGMTEKELHTNRRRFTRYFHRKTWDAETQRAFQGWIRKAVQDKQAKAVGVVTSNRRR